MCGYMPIIDVYSREILDSGGNPAIEVEIMTEDGTVGRAAVPSGVSGDGHGAVPPVNDFAAGNCVTETCHLMNSVFADTVIGENVYEQASIDRLLHRKIRDAGSLTRSGLRGVSMAVAVTAAKSLCLPLYRYLGGICADRLPMPMVTLLNGRRHAAKTGSEITVLSDVREFMIIPAGACTYEKGLRMCMEVCRIFWKMLEERQAYAGEMALLSPEGDDRFAANRLSIANQASLRGRMDTESVLSLILEAVKKAGYQPGTEIALALDVAADTLYEESSGSYVFLCEEKLDRDEVRKRTEEMPKAGVIRRSTEEMIVWLEKLCGSFPVLSIVDGLSKNDREGWKKLTRRLGGRVRLVADRLFEGEPEGLSDGHSERIANVVLVKADQFETLTDLMRAAELARDGGYEIVFSHSSGETLDTLIADLAVAVGGAQIRAGAPCRAECVAKYNRLLRIEDSLGLAARNHSLCFRG